MSLLISSLINVGWSIHKRQFIECLRCLNGRNLFNDSTFPRNWDSRARLFIKNSVSLKSSSIPYARPHKYESRYRMNNGSKQCESKQKIKAKQDVNIVCRARTISYTFLHCVHANKLSIFLKARQGGRSRRRSVWVTTGQLRFIK